MKSLFAMWRYVKPYWKQALGAVLLLAGVVAADLGIPRLTQAVIDTGVMNQDLQAVWQLSALMLVAAVASALFSIGNTLLSVRVAANVGADIRDAIVRKVQTFSFGNLDRLQTGELLVRATSDVTQVQNIVNMSMRILTRMPLWLLGSVVMLAINTPQLVPLMAVLMVLVLIGVSIFLIKGQPLYARVQEKLDTLNQVLQENLSGVRVVKAFVRADYEVGRFDKVNEEQTSESIKVAQLMALLLPTMTLLINFGVIGVLWQGGQGFETGQFTAGEIMASFNYLTFSLFPLLMLAGMIGPMSAADASAGRILEILESEAEVKNHPKFGEMPSIDGQVMFENVSFSYDGDESETVLTNINLTAEPGQRVAILGATGSGKSSLVHLIPRFYDVKSGRVLLDGVDIRDYPLHGLRKQIGIAMQEAVLFSGTIRDNIRYGAPDASDEAVVQAAKMAQAHDFIKSFPKGYDTTVGQRGVNLSGGQKQRMSIARALLVNPKVLILDDSTSAVDVATETKIEDALELLMQDTTSFIIAQRISTVLNADKIVVLERGAIVAEGTHADLMKESAIYREIYDSQLGSGPGTMKTAD